MNNHRVLKQNRIERSGDDVKKALIPSIIKRREIDPVLSKAARIAGIYKKAVKLNVFILDDSGYSHPEINGRASEFFCALCKKYRHDPNNTRDSLKYPCTKMHMDSIGEAQRAGGVYIYTCALGFMYWICPLLSGGRYAGSLIAAALLVDPALNMDQKRTIEKIHKISGGEISRDEAASYLKPVALKSYEEIKALAHMLLVSAKKITNDTETRGERERYKEMDSAYLSPRSGKSGRNGAYEMASLVDKERIFLAALRRGDMTAAKKNFNELFGFYFNNLRVPKNRDSDSVHGEGPNNERMKILRLRAIELVVLLSRAAAAKDNADISETNNCYLRRIQEAVSVKELHRILNTIVDQMGSRLFSFQGVCHASALRKAECFIWENYTRKISLKEIAHASGLSAPYFSTVFKNEMGEKLSVYLNHLRVEKAASMLLETNLSLSEIAAASGFEDQSWFSKTFKKYTGTSPGKYWIKGRYQKSLKGEDV